MKDTGGKVHILHGETANPCMIFVISERLTSPHGFQTRIHLQAVWSRIYQDNDILEDDIKQGSEKVYAAVQFDTQSLWSNSKSPRRHCPRSLLITLLLQNLKSQPNPARCHWRCSSSVRSSSFPRTACPMRFHISARTFCSEYCVSVLSNS